jgi:succinate dehydrogenase / fumarate reductase iron-sulfur subunit
LVDKLEEPITLEPMSKFPLIRDLFVDRQRLFDDLKRVKAWVPIDGTYDLGSGPPISQDLANERYPLSRCISCGCCLEACPQYTPSNHFVGAAVISQVRLFNDHPIGKALKSERLDVMMEAGGVADCGKAGNCVEVCPKEIPLLESIAAVQRQATVHTIKSFFSK